MDCTNRYSFLNLCIIHNQEMEISFLSRYTVGQINLVYNYIASLNEVK